MDDSQRNDDKLSTVSRIWPVSTSAQCEAAKSKIGYSTKRADTDKLREVFDKFASVSQHGERFMTPVDFVQRFLGLLTDGDHNADTLCRLASCVDTTKDGLISFVEFQAFENLLSAPDAVYALAFQLFDTKSSGDVSYDEFHEIIKRTRVHNEMPFSFDSDFIRLYFGGKRQRRVGYADFTQLLHDFHEEHALQAFKRMDRNDTGFISPLDFHSIMTNLKAHLLTPFVQQNLVAVAGGGKGGQQVSYPYFTACVSLLNNMELIKKIFTSATKPDGLHELTKEEFLQEAQKFTQITPLEVDILFQLCSVRQQTGRVTYDDILSMSQLQDDDSSFRVTSPAVQSRVQETFDLSGRGVGLQLMENGYRFVLGAIAGALGATAVYPIDLVKTRIQNQRAGSYVGELMYKNSLDCFRKVIRYEGVFGLYRGIIPQLVGVAPEKAIKLTMNDLMRDKLSKTGGHLPLAFEVLSGCIAGASQVVFTNPLEIVKIRLQVAGEVVTNKRISAGSVIKDLGFFGLYKGAKACFLRDIPFSGIYFTAYAHMKRLTCDANGYNGPLSLLLSATVSGAPAAALTTPADVIKTRLQVVAREGQTTYSGVFDTAKKIWQEEGGRAFWKGTPARIFRSSPQFGVTLMTYELLQRWFYIDFGGQRPSGSAIVPTTEVQQPVSRDHIGGYRHALMAFQGIEMKFGLCLPRFRTGFTPAVPVGSVPGGTATPA